MEKIIISSLVDDKMDELVDVLYEDEYYGFMDDAIAYVVAIYNFINTIPNQNANSLQIHVTANTIAGISMTEELFTTSLSILITMITSY